MTKCGMCGDCCDPVMLQNSLAKILEYEHIESDVPIDVKNRHLARFARENWVEIDVREGFKSTVYCKKFDRVKRTCTAQDDKPYVCSEYPYYGQEPVESDRGDYLYARCSFNQDFRTYLPIVSVT